MEEIINGYRILSPFSPAGAGSARWTFAEKDGAEYFLKEFLTPVFPVDSLPMPDSVRESRISLCEKFEMAKSRLYKAIRNADNGNIVGIQEFFLHEAKYYISTFRIDGSGLDTQQVSEMPFDKKKVLVRVLLNNMRCLEKEGVVHADLKPSNIIIKPTTGGFFSLKLIDFDSSFFAGNPPEDCEELQGDPVYLAPEMFLAMRGENVSLNCKVDVFAAGLIIHEMLTGRLPAFPDDCDYAFEAALEGAELELDESIPAEYRKIIRDMLSADPAVRPGFTETFERFAAVRVVPGAEAMRGSNMKPAGEILLTKNTVADR